jgi:hypothetical protein
MLKWECIVIYHNGIYYMFFMPVNGVLYNILSRIVSHGGQAMNGKSAEKPFPICTTLTKCAVMMFIQGMGMPLGWVMLVGDMSFQEKMSGSDGQVMVSSKLW